jgi:hypothetical protein
MGNHILSFSKAIKLLKSNFNTKKKMVLTGIDMGIENVFKGN